MNQYDQCTLDDVEDALSFLDPSCDRDTWVVIGMAIKAEFGDMGKTEFENWSMGSDKFSKSNFNSTWRSLKQGGGTTIRTLFKMAMDAGFKPEQPELSEAEKQKRFHEAQVRRVEREKEALAEKVALDELQDCISGVCQSVWASDYLSYEGESDYLKRKQVSSFGAKFVCRSFMIVVDLERNTAFTKFDHKEMMAITEAKKANPDSISFLWLKKDTLVLPMFDMAGKLWSLQFVLPNGTKLFIKCSKKRGTCFLLGEIQPNSAPSPICSAEGFATGASIVMATGYPVFVCWDSGNLLAMTPQIAKAFPNHPLLVCGDNDQSTEGNPGLAKAKEAASASSCGFVVPSFESLLTDIKEAANG
jgi:putative DNA primase/helicase